MADSPYAPPKSAVADLEPARGESPREIRIAVRLIYASILLGLVTAAVDPLITATTGPAFVAMLMMLAVTLAVTALLAMLIGKGHNWARIVYSVLTVLGTAMMFFVWEAGEAWYLQVSTIAQTILQLAAIYSLFTPASSGWLRRRG